jgi:hypothetical protein
MVNSAMELAAVDSEVGEVVRAHLSRLERKAPRNARRRGRFPRG